MQSRGLTPVYNAGDGNCVFISLAQIVFGDPTKFAFMRYMIIHRLKSFPKKYHKFPNYYNSMAINNRPASELELQVIADICHSVVECYSTNDYLKPTNTIRPLRFCESTSYIRLWIKDDHCVALVDHQCPPLIGLLRKKLIGSLRKNLIESLRKKF